MPYAVPLFTWTGFYLGINGGGAFGSSTWDTAGSINTSGGLVGGTVGYNYQISHFVVGAEADIDWAGISGTTTTAACPAGCKTGDSWLSTVRGRVGYAADRFLPFVTGGAALGNINATTAGECWMDGRRGPRIRLLAELVGQSRVPLRQPRQVQLRFQLRRADRQRLF